MAQFGYFEGMGMGCAEIGCRILSIGLRDWTYTASDAEGHIASYYVD